MSETTKTTTEEVETTTEEVVEKPYEFRKLGSKDVFLMATIVSKIGINEFMACMESKSMKSLVEKLTSKKTYIKQRK